MGVYNQILQQAQGVAGTPYQSYTGQLVAPNNAQQNAGISNINANAGFANPYIQQATGLASGAANPLTQSQIQNYMSPYTQNVVDATQNQFNNQNALAASNMKGNTIAQGALGGNRAAVGQATLAGQQQASQAPVIAGLYNQGYGQALSTAAQQYQQNPMAAAGQLANFGLSGQNAALQGAQAQIGAGTLQQGTQQAQDTAAYQQFEQQQAYPFQTAQWLAGIGLPIASQLGTTSQGQTTTPGPSPWSQIAGTAIAGAGLFLRDGGAVHKAGAGGVGGFPYGAAPMPYSGVSGYVPTAPQISLHALQPPSAPQPYKDTSTAGQDALKGGITDFGKAMKSSSPSYGGGNFFTDAWGGSSSSPLEGLSASDYGAGFAHGGGVSGFPRGYADGGSPMDDAPWPYGPAGDTFASRFDSAYPVDPMGAANREAGMLRDKLAPSTEGMPRFDENGRLLGNMTSDQGQKPTTSIEDEPLPQPGGGVSPMARPTVAAATPFARDDTRAGFGSPSPAAAEGPGAGDQGGAGHGFGLGYLSPNVKQALLSAGLGMLASRSPNFGNAIGEGGLRGVQAYSEAQAADLKAAQDKIKQQQEDRRISFEAQRISQEAQRAADAWALGASGHAETERHNKASEAIQSDKAPTGYQRNKDGSLAYIKGGPHDPESI